MANEEEEEKLDLTSRLVDTYQKANAALLERVSIMKESYKQAAREDELVKQVLANAKAASKNKKLSRDLQREATEGDVLSTEIEKERLKLEEKINQLSADKKLVEAAARKAKRDGLKEETELYNDIAKELEEATAQLEKMDDAAAGVRDKAAEIEDKSGSSFFQGLKDALPSGFTKTLDGIGDAFGEGAKEAKKVRMETDKANEAASELDKIEEVKFKKKGSDVEQTRFRFKKGMDPKGPGQRFVSGDKVKGLQSAAKGAKGAAGGLMKSLGAGIKKFAKQIFKVLKKALGPIGLIMEVVQALGQVDQEVTELGKGLTLSRKEAVAQRDAFANTAAASGDIFVTTEKIIKANNTLNKALGTAVAFNGEILTTATQILEKVKLTGEATAGLAGQSVVTGGSFRENYENALETSYAIQRQSGVAVDLREVLEAVGKTTGQIRAQLGGSTEAIAEAVTQAKTLGMELSDVAAAGKQLLDFESSIANELEAELLTGKQLNLEKARLAALTGDFATLSKEIAEQAGDFTEFSKMNVLQQDALAKSLGMQSDQLADILFKQEVQGKTARELRAMGKDELAAQLERTTAQDKFNAAMDKLKSLLADLVSPLIPFFDILGPILGLVGKVVTVLMPALNAIKFLVTGIVDLVMNVLGVFMEMATFGLADTSGMFGFEATGASFDSMVDYGLGGNPQSAGPAGAAGGQGMAEGGMVKATPGGVQVTVAEGGQDEIISPIDKVPGFGNNNVEIDYDKMARANAAAMSNVTVSSAPFNSWGSRSQMATDGVNVNQLKNRRAV